jgi:asparagine N-glycosylation enzyme membrane subunit Stt3
MTHYLSKKNALIFLFSLIGIILVHYNAILAVFHQRYFVYEHDAYLHMVLALDILKSHQWYAGINPLINAPYGADTHAWSQATMIVLVGGTYLFKLFFPLKKALYKYLSKSYKVFFTVVR